MLPDCMWLERDDSDHSPGEVARNSESRQRVASNLSSTEDSNIAPRSLQQNKVVSERNDLPKDDINMQHATPGNVPGHRKTNHEKSSITNRNHFPARILPRGMCTARTSASPASLQKAQRDRALAKFLQNERLHVGSDRMKNSKMRRLHDSADTSTNSFGKSPAPPLDRTQQAAHFPHTSRVQESELPKSTGTAASADLKPQNHTSHASKRSRDAADSSFDVNGVVSRVPLHTLEQTEKFAAATGPSPEIEHREVFGRQRANTRSQHLVSAMPIPTKAPNQSLVRGESGTSKRLGSRIARPVIPEDIAVLRLREQGFQWKEIADAWVARGMPSLTTDVLRHRYNKVITALKEVGILHDQNLLDAVANGNMTAYKALNAQLTCYQKRDPITLRSMQLLSKNRIVDGAPEGSISLSKQISISSASELKFTHTSACGFALDERKMADPSHQMSSDTSRLSHAADSKYDELGCRMQGPPRLDSSHPTTVEKTLANIQAIYAAASAERDDTSGEESEVTMRDYCYFAYQVLCRERPDSFLRSDDFDMELTEDESEWVECGVFENLTDANTALIHMAFASSPGRPQYVGGHAQITMTQSYSANGELRYRIVNDLVGTLDHKVHRFLRTRQDGIPPSSKEGWLPKKIYTVRKIVIQTSTEQDELFGDAISKVSTIERPVDNLCFSALQMANECAINAFVAATYKPSTNRLEVIGAEKTRLRNSLHDQIALDTEYFDQNWEHGRIWVEEGELRGPRNL